MDAEIIGKWSLIKYNIFGLCLNKMIKDFLRMIVTIQMHNIIMVKEFKERKYELIWNKWLNEEHFEDYLQYTP